jgi:branched-chain amino acid transport system substrate-binding protein
MMKGWFTALCALALCCSMTSCRSEQQKMIKIGVNAPITGDIPKVGEGTKYAAELWLEEVNKAGGIEVGGKKYPVALVVEDSEAKAESAVKANTRHW